MHSKENLAEEGGFFKRTNKEEQQKRVRAFSIFDWEEEASVRCWKRVMDIIFSTKWKVLIILSVFFTLCIVILRIQTTPSTWNEELSHLNSLQTICTCIYLLDTIVRIVHMKVKSMRVSQSHKMYPPIYTVLDIFSLIPIEYMYGTVIPARVLPYPENYDLTSIFYVNQVLRIYRIPLSLTELDITLTFNPVQMYFLNALSLLFILIIIQSCVWLQILGRWYWSEGNWLAYVVYSLHREDSVAWFIVSVTTVLSMFCRYFDGTIQLTNNAERVTAAITWFLGVIFEYGILLGGLLPAIGSEHKLRYDYNEFVLYLEHDMKVRGVAQRTVERTRNYYTELWQRASGVKEAILFKTFPLSFRKEFMLDCFWDAFKHSSLLSPHPLEVKRSLCMVMEHEYYLPGEYLFRAGNVKDKMVYIVSGVVDVLAVEDGCTAVASFSSGTCMTEASLLYQFRGPNSVRCATFCVVQILYAYDALRVLKDYPKSASEIAEILMQRIHLASEVRHNAEALRPTELDPLDEHAILLGEIKWVKDHWRRIFEMDNFHRRHKKTSRRHKLQKLQTLGSGMSSATGSQSWQMETSRTTSYKSKSGISGPEQTETHHSLLVKDLGDEYEDYISRFAHTSAFFDLFALTDESQKAEEDVVCARVNFPCILKTESDFTMIWEIILVIVVALECYVLPFYLSFYQTSPNWVNGWAAVSDAIVIGDMVITILKAVPGVPRNLFSVVKYRMQTTEFYLKLLASIPWHWLAIAWKVDEYDATRLRYIRLIWMVKIIKWFDKWIQRVGEHIYPVKYVVIFISIIYWLTCVHFLFDCYYGICLPGSWYHIHQERQAANAEYSDDQSDKVHNMMLYIASNVLRISFTSEAARGYLEVVLLNFTLCLSLIITSYFLAEFCSLQMLRGRSKRKFKDLLSRVEYYNQYNKIPEMTFQQLNLFLKFQWQNNPVFDVIDDKEKASLPRYLLDDIQETARETVRAIPLFASTTSELVEELSKAVKFYHCPKAMQLIRAGEHAVAVYVVRKGLCRAVSHWRSDVERNLDWSLTPGDCFPIMEVMHGIPSILTVLTDTACVVAMIEVHKMQKILAKFPAEQRLLESVVHEHKAIWNLAEAPMEDPTMKRQWREQEGRARRRMLRRYMSHRDRKNDTENKGEYKIDIESNIEQSEDKYEEEEMEYERVWRESRFGGFLRKLMRPVSFDPAREFVFMWEAIRVTLALVACLLHPLAYGAFIDSIVIRSICYFLDLYSFVDILMRFQIGYYNANGILVSHPALTASYYFKNSFFADLISCFPLELMPVAYLVSLNNLALLRFYIRLGRVLQLYRFFTFMNHLAKRLSYRFLTSNIAKVIVIIVMIMNLMANNNVYTYCDVEATGRNMFYFDDVKVQCEFPTLRRGLYLRMMMNTPWRAYLLSLYHGILLYTTSIDGLIVYQKNALSTLVICLITFIARNWLIAVLSCNISASRWRITNSRHLLEQVVGFLRHEGVDDRLVRLTQDAFDYEWSRGRGFHMPDVLNKVPPLLKTDMMFNRCAKTLSLVKPLQGAPDFLLRELSRNVDLHLFNKGRFVFRLNDVQDCVYILERGRVEVIGAGNASLCMLRKGALFGNLPRQPRMRQTCGILARVNCLVMSLPNEMLYGILEKFPAILHHFDHIHEAQLEYVVELRHDPNKDMQSRRKDLIGWAATRQDLLTIYGTKKSMFSKGRNIRRYLQGLNKSGTLKSLSLSFVMYFVIPASVICAFLVTALRKDYPFFTGIIYFCDSCYVIKILTVFWVTEETDSEEGEVNKRVWLKKFVNPFALPLDVISTLPLEFIGYRWFRYNRTLRLISFIKFYMWKYNQLSASMTSRWARLIILMAMILAFLTSLHILVRCDRGAYCESLTDVNRMRKSYFRIAFAPSDIISLGFMYAVNRLTCASFSEPPINHMRGLLFNVIITVVDHVIMVFFSAYVACLVCGARSYRSDFRFLVDRMDLRLKVMNVTEPIRRKAKKYFSYLWRDEKGYAMPKWIATGPKDLRFDILAVMYGNYLRNDPVLGQGHEDLLLQITGYIHRNIFFPRDVIAQRGDVNGCLYILQSGEVKAMVEDEFQMEAVAFKVPPGRLFGVKSGLYEGKAHEYTYRATTVSVVLTLHQDDWKHLFEFFPASELNIFTQASHATI